MFLMFAYKRLDVFSIGDIALRRAISEIYNIDQEDQKEIIKISKRWSPYRSVVCWYLWEYLGV
jgi:DNA-3-methyladenine glycosylase II